MRPATPNDSQLIAFCEYCSAELYARQPTHVTGCVTRRPSCSVACRPDASCRFDSAAHIGCYLTRRESA